MKGKERGAVRRSKYFKSSPSFELKRLRNHFARHFVRGYCSSDHVQRSIQPIDLNILNFFARCPPPWDPPWICKNCREFEIAAPILLAVREHREPLMTR